MLHEPVAGAFVREESFAVGHVPDRLVEAVVEAHRELLRVVLLRGLSYLAVGCKRKGNSVNKNAYSFVEIIYNFFVNIYCQE